MPAPPYMQLYWGDYDVDTMELSLEEHGAYLLLIKVYWQRQRPLPNDDKKLARILRVSPQKWRKIRARIESFFEITDTELRHKRVDFEIARFADKSLKRKAAAEKSHEVRRANAGASDHANAIVNARGLQSTRARQSDSEPDTESIEDSADAESLSSGDDDAVDLSDILNDGINDSPPPKSPKPKPPAKRKKVVITPKMLDDAFDAYNEMAERAGLPMAQVFTEKRRNALRKRLVEAGGIEGWHVALGKVETSPHCTGDNDINWRASLDFMLQASSFVRLMEGNYDGLGIPRRGNALADAFDRIREDMSGGPISDDE